MKIELVCPNCGDENSITWKSDAWAIFEIIGVNDRGELVKSAAFDTQIFDENRIECSTCGELFDDQEIINLLRLAAD